MITVFLALTAVGADLELDLETRREAAIVVLAPFGMSEEHSVSSVIDEAVKTFKEHTNLRLLPAAQVGIDEARLRECPAALRTACWIDLAEETPIVFFLIVSVVGGERGDELAVWGFDLTARERAEVEPRSLSPGLFTSLVEGPLRPILKGLNAFRGFGSVLVDTDCADCKLHVDDRPPIDISAGRVNVRGIDRGRHEVRLHRGDETVCTHSVEVAATAQPVLDCTGIAPTARSQDVVTYAASGAVAAIGLVMITWSAAAAGTTTRVCIRDAPSACDFGPSPRPGESMDGVVPYTPGSIPVAPLGVGLAASGFTAIATTWIFDRAPWWTGVLAGVIGGVVFGGIALAVD